MVRAERGERTEKGADKVVQEDAIEVKSEAAREGRRGPASPHNVATPARSSRTKDATSGGDKGRGPTSALEDLMRRKGVDEAWNALDEMQRQGVTTDKYTVSRMLMKTVGDGRTRLNPSRVYRGISLVERFIDMQPRDVDEVLFNALLDTCCRLKDLSRLEATVQRMRDLKVSPSPVTLGILVKTYGQAGDLQKVLQVWGEMEKQRGQANAVTYGCMIDACVKCGHLEKAVEIFKGMRKAGKHRNTILYTTLIKGYGLDKDLSSALELFREMPQEGVPYNTITYNSIIDACIKSGDLAAAEGLLREMTAPDSQLEPDLITFSTLLKGYCHVGDLDKALQVAEAIKARGLRCDELVYNTLMDGCVKANDITAGVGLFEEMVQNGMRPSAITNSILARLYQRAGYEEGASDAVAELYQHHGIERPSGNDRGKGGAKKWGLKSPSRDGERGSVASNQSPLGSPSSRGGFHHRRDSSDSWSTWGEVPALPAYEGGAEPSAPSTPLASAGAYLPMEALRGHMVPPLPGSGPMMHGSYSPSPCMSPAGMEHPSMFSMPPSPHTLQHVSARLATGPSLPPWPYQCGTFPGAGFTATSPTHMSSVCGCEGAMQQVIAMPVIQAPGPPPHSPPSGVGASTVPGTEGHYPHGLPQQQPPPPPPGAAPVPANMAPGTCVAAGTVQGIHAHQWPCPQPEAHQTPFPMPLSPPHDMSYYTNQGLVPQQAYYDGWNNSGQQVPGMAMNIAQAGGQQQFRP